MSLPSELSYPKLRTAAIAAVSTTYKTYPSNSGSTWSPSNILSFDIPTGIRSQWLDPAQTFLQFTVTPTMVGTGTLKWSARGYDFIRSIQVYSSAGSNLLESCDQYNALWSALRTLNSTEDHAKYSDSVTMGVDPTRPRMGRVQTQATTGVASTSMTYAIPLTSILGLQTAGQLYLPTHALNSPLRIEITLASAESALSCSATTITAGHTYAVTTPFISCGLITISDVAQSQLSQMTGGVYNFNSEIWRNFRSTHPAATTNNTLMIPARFSSLKSIITTFRDSTVLELPLAYSINDFIRANLKTYQLKVGSAYVNPQPVDCTGNAVPAFMELKRTFDGLTSQSVPTLVTIADWIHDTLTVPTDTALAGSFFIGNELEPFSNNKLLTGTSSVGQNMFLDLVFSTAPPALTVDSWVCADALFSIQNGQMTVSF